MYRNDITEEILEALSYLRPRELEAIALRFDFFGEGRKTLKQAGEIMGVSRERVRQLERNALRRVKKHPHTRMILKELAENLGVGLTEPYCYYLKQDL